MDRSEALERLRTARVGRLATITPGGRPHVVPLVFALVEDGPSIRAYWVVDAKPKSSIRLQRLRNLEHRSAVELLVDGYDEDWSRLWWVRASGTGRIADDLDERTAALSALHAKYPQYSDLPTDGPVVAIEIERVRGWEATPRSG